MSEEKSEILERIRSNESKISSMSDELREKRADLDALLSIQRNFNNHEKDFSDDIQRRRNKIQGAFEILTNSIIANSYCSKMDEELNGSSYNAISGQISTMTNNINAKIDETRNEIENLEGQISNFESQNSELHDNYDRLVKEENKSE